MEKKSCFIFGLGYVGRRLAVDLVEKGWRVGGSVRTIREKDEYCKGFLIPKDCQVFEIGSDDNLDEESIREMLKGFTHVVFTAPVDRSRGCDPFLGSKKVNKVLIELAEEGEIVWGGYLSTTSVYGDCKGEWVTEESPVQPSLKRGIQRANVEKSFLCSGLPIHIFRLPGIYGPNRGPISKIRAGKIRSIVKKGQIFSRIHVDDIVGVIYSSISNPNPGRIYNVTDDDPQPNYVCIEYACQLMNVNSPIREDFEKN